jgi:uncharacterized membrane protein YebE (DUF533 family)
MFDAKSLIEMMMKGATGQAPQAAPPQAGGLGGLGDLLGQVLGGAAQARGGAGQGGGMPDLGAILGQLGGAAGQQTPQMAPGAPAQGGGGGGLEDLLKQLGGGRGGQDSAPAQADSGGLGGGLEDMLRKLQGQSGGAAGAGGGGLMDILGQVLGQATAGVREGAERMDQATGASERMRQATGQGPGDLLEQLKELVRQNQLGAGAAAGGLGALVLGTKTGRSLAMKAAKIGGLALIGGLAYKAMQNYQAGRPLISSADDIAPAPSGTGYEPAAVTQESALLYVRGMIAAAAADGRIDETEQRKILGNLQQIGINAEAEEFLANELNNPASPADLAAAVQSPEQAVQLFTAARFAITDDTEEEHAFLAELAQSLGIDEQLAQHVDAAARAA